MVSEQTPLTTSLMTTTLGEHFCARSCVRCELSPFMTTPTSGSLTLSDKRTERLSNLPVVWQLLLEPIIETRFDFKGHTCSHFTNNASSVCVGDSVDNPGVTKNTLRGWFVLRNLLPCTAHQLGDSKGRAVSTAMCWQSSNAREGGGEGTLGTSCV